MEVFTLGPNDEVVTIRAGPDFKSFQSNLGKAMKLPVNSLRKISTGTGRVLETDDDLRFLTQKSWIVVEYDIPAGYTAPVEPEPEPESPDHSSDELSGDDELDLRSDEAKEHVPVATQSEDDLSVSKEIQRSKEEAAKWENLSLSRSTAGLSKPATKLADNALTQSSRQLRQTLRMSTRVRLNELHLEPEWIVGLVVWDLAEESNAFAFGKRGNVVVQEQGLLWTDPRQPTRVVYALQDTNKTLFTLSRDSVAPLTTAETLKYLDPVTFTIHNHSFLLRSKLSVLMTTQSLPEAEEFYRFLYHLFYQTAASKTPIRRMDPNLTAPPVNPTFRSFRELTDAFRQAITTHKLARLAARSEKQDLVATYLHNARQSYQKVLHIADFFESTFESQVKAVIEAVALKNLVSLHSGDENISLAVFLSMLLRSLDILLPYEEQAGLLSGTSLMREFRIAMDALDSNNASQLLEAGQAVLAYPLPYKYSARHGLEAKLIGLYGKLADWLLVKRLSSQQRCELHKLLLEHLVKRLGEAEAQPIDVAAYRGLVSALEESPDVAVREQAIALRESLGDFVIVVSCGASHKTLHVFSEKLRTRSAYFETLLNGAQGFKENESKRIDLQAIELSEDPAEDVASLTAVIEYLNTNHIDIDPSNVLDFLLYANQYQIPTLYKIAKDFFASHLPKDASAEEAETLMEYAELLEDEQLEKFAIQLLANTVYRSMDELIWRKYPAPSQRLEEYDKFHQNFPSSQVCLLQLSQVALLTALNAALVNYHEPFAEHLLGLVKERIGGAVGGREWPGRAVPVVILPQLGGNVPRASEGLQDPRFVALSTQNFTMFDRLQEIGAQLSAIKYQTSGNSSHNYLSMLVYAGRVEFNPDRPSCPSGLIASLEKLLNAVPLRTCLGNTGQTQWITKTALEGSPEVLRSLLLHELDTTVALNPTFNATRSGPYKPSQEIENLDKFSFPMHYAVMRGCVETVDCLLLAGSPPDKLAHGLNPLHVAALLGFTEKAQLLLEFGAAVDATTTLGWTPLHFATACGHLAVVELLLRYNAVHTASARLTQDDPPTFGDCFKLADHYATDASFQEALLNLLSDPVSSAASSAAPVPPPLPGLPNQANNTANSNANANTNSGGSRTRRSILRRAGRRQST